jgi:general secretion pathway protein A
MFLQHFKLRTQPFAEHASVNSLWQDPRMEEAQARLTFLVDHGTLGLLTGASGLGKSALIKQFMHGLSPQHCEAVYCHLTHLPGSGLLRAVLNQLGEAPRRGKERLYEQLRDRAARLDGGLLLVFDEAHLLDGDALTDVRLLISSALDIGPPLKILLSGQDSLRSTLKRARHHDLANRISVRYQFRPFSKADTGKYIDHHMQQAGGSSQIFDDSAKMVIHDYTGGVPRQINQVATQCLIQATAGNVVRVDDELLQQVLSEIHLG